MSPAPVLCRRWQHTRDTLLVTGTGCLPLARKCSCGSSWVQPGHQEAPLHGALPTPRSWQWLQGTVDIPTSKKGIGFCGSFSLWTQRSEVGSTHQSYCQP